MTHNPFAPPDDMQAAPKGGYLRPEPPTLKTPVGTIVYLAANTKPLMTVSGVRLADREAGSPNLLEVLWITDTGDLKTLAAPLSVFRVYR
jgi:hypothetical protein